MAFHIFTEAPCLRKLFMFHHFSLPSYLQFENPNMSKHIINNKVLQKKLSFIV